jgi:hypothetical protein
MSNAEFVCPRYLSAFFFDQLEGDVEESATLIGVHRLHLRVDSFPTSIPKLVVWMSAITPSDRPFQNLTFVVFQDNLQVFAAEASSNDLGRLRQRSQDFQVPGEPPVQVEVICVATLDGIEAKESCVLSARMATEEGVYISRILSISSDGNESLRI